MPDRMAEQNVKQIAKIDGRKNVRIDARQNIIERMPDRKPKKKMPERMPDTIIQQMPDIMPEQNVRKCMHISYIRPDEMMSETMTNLCHGGDHSK